MSTAATAISLVIILIGMGGTILKKNLLMKLLSLSIVNTATILFFVLIVYRPGDRAPIKIESTLQVVDPLPQALVLTSIVINFGILAFALLFIMLLVKNYHTLDTERIESLVKEDYEGEDR